MTVFGGIYKRILLNTKIVDCCESNNKLDRVSRINMKPCKLQGRTAGSQGGLDKNMSGQNMSGKEYKVKSVSG